MTRTPDPIALAAARGGRAIGAMFFSGFGGLWLGLWAYSEFPASVIGLSAIGAATLGMLALSYATYRRYAEAHRVVSRTPDGQRMSRIFNLVNAGQWVVMFLLAWLLTRLHRSDLILPAVIFVIGVHFIPLARLFGYPPHYLTGLALIALAVVYPMLASEGAESAVGALGAGVILWASAIWALVPHADAWNKRRHGA